MMNADELYLCKQIVSLKLARRLHGMGVPQRSLFVWEEAEGEWYPALDTISAESDREGRSTGMHSAFMASELGAMLPSCVTIYKQSIGGHWTCTDRGGGVLDAEERRLVRATTMPDALAKMLIRLIESGSIHLPRVTQIEFDIEERW